LTGYTGVAVESGTRLTSGTLVGSLAEGAADDCAGDAGVGEQGVGTSAGGAYVGCVACLTVGDAAKIAAVGEWRCSNSATAAEIVSLTEQAGSLISRKDCRC
jgi:hypothetical protein